MIFKHPTSLKEIAEILDAPFFGNEAVEIKGINEIHRVEKGDIAFVDHPKYYSKALNSNASVLLINKEVEVPEGKAIIVGDDPFSMFNKLLNYFNPFHFTLKQQDDSLITGSNCQIHPSVAIGRNVTIGDNCLIFPNVSIGNDVKIGNNVIIQSGTVIGSFGFYYKNRGDRFDRLLTSGDVIIEDEVEIGANCTIDKGVTASTIIGAGSKLDNLIQIGHDTTLGKRCLIAAGCGIAGCVSIGDRVTIWGQVGIASGISIEDDVVIQAQAGVGKSLEKGKVYLGSPAMDSRSKMREWALLKRLPELFQPKVKSDGQ